MSRVGGRTRVVYLIVMLCLFCVVLLGVGVDTVMVRATIYDRVWQARARYDSLDQQPAPYPPHLPATGHAGRSCSDRDDDERYHPPIEGSDCAVVGGGYFGGPGLQQPSAKRARF